MSERNGDYCQKCGAPIAPTDEKCPNGHVLAEVFKRFERRASATISFASDAISKKVNDFEKIIDKCGIEVEEDDLLKLLDIKLDFYSKMYIVIIGMLIQGFLILKGIEPIETSSPLVAAIFIIGLFAALIGLSYFGYMFLRNSPFQTQREVLQELIDARTRLRKLKKEQTS